MGLCGLYYVEYSFYKLKKVNFFYLGWNFTLNRNAMKYRNRLNDLITDIFISNVRFISHPLFKVCLYAVLCRLSIFQLY